MSFDNTKFEKRAEADIEDAIESWLDSGPNCESLWVLDTSRLASQMAAAAFAVYRGAIAGQKDLIAAINTGTTTCEYEGIDCGCDESDD